MTTKVKGIVLGGTNYKEKDKIVNIFTIEQGIISASMRGVRGDKARLKTAKDAFCFGDFILEEGKTGFIVTGVDIVDNFFGITKDIGKYYESCAVLDVIRKTIVEPNPLIFIETIKALKTLCYENVPKYYVIDKFLISFFKEMGLSFITENCSSCGAVLGARYFNLDIGEFVCASCENSSCISVTNACYSAIKILDGTDYDKLSSIKFGGMGEIQVFHLLEKNYKWRFNLHLLKLE